MKRLKTRRRKTGGVKYTTMLSPKKIKEIEDERRKKEHPIQQLRLKLTKKQPQRTKFKKDIQKEHNKRKTKKTIRLAHLKKKFSKKKIPSDR
jgi:hypothetical protein